MLEHGPLDAEFQRASVAEWLGRWTRNSEVVGSSPTLTTKLELFLGRS